MFSQSGQQDSSAGSSGKNKRPRQSDGSSGAPARAGKVVIGIEIWGYVFFFFLNDAFNSLFF